MNFEWTANSARRAVASVRCAVLGLTVLATTPSSGQNSAPPFLAGIPYDWSHHHLVFAAPKDAKQAAQLEQEPRYLHQQARRKAFAAWAEASVMRRPYRNR